MRKILIMAGAMLFMACSSNQSKDEMATGPASDSSKTTQEPAYDYPVNYAGMAMGDIRYTQTIVTIWKEFDNGNVLPQKEKFADTAEFHTWDGFAYRGPRDSVIAKGQEYRNSFAAVSSSVNGIISFTGTNKISGMNENWVAVWGKRLYTDKKGKIDSMWLHEAWRLNGNGKIDVLYQFNAKISDLP